LQYLRNTCDYVCAGPLAVDRARVLQVRIHLPPSGSLQTSVLAQLGLINAATLPVCGADTARKALDPSLPANALIRRASTAIGLTRRLTMSGKRKRKTFSPFREWLRRN